MKIEYKDNINAGPGNGILIFSESLFPDPPWAISIQRASDKKFLTGKQANPWVGENISLPVTGEALPDGTLAISIGPQIVDLLDQQEQYAVTLRGEGQEEKGRLRVRSITYSPGGSLGITPDAPQTEKPETQPQVEPEPAPRPTPPPVQNPEPQPTAPPSSEQPLVLPHAEPGRKIWRWVIMGILIAGCLAWYFIEQYANKEKAEAPVAVNEPKPEAAPAIPAAQPKMTVEDEVQAFFKSDKKNPAAALALALKLPDETPSDKDALYRLYYFAAENGEQQAMRKYAEILDPSLPPWGSIEKNAVAALEYYKKSPDHEIADKAIAHMRQWIAEQAQSGNAKARQWQRELSEKP